MRTQQSGFTLIEIVIVTAVLFIMFASVLGTFNVAQDACSMGTANLALQRTNTSCMAKMTRKMRESSIIDCDGINGLWIQLQVPVDHDHDGDVTDDDGEIEWGAENTLNYSYRYRYVFDGTFVEAEQGNNGIDLNRDGQKDRTFRLGHIEEQLVDNSIASNPASFMPDQAPGPEVVSFRAISSSYIVSCPDQNWDVSGDWMTDRLFTRVTSQGVADDSGTNVRISFYTFKLAQRDRTVFLHPTSLVATRNLVQSP
ncbi:MAG: type II secretion system protein [Candidatus Eisenbacteria bacterium]|nr:type II secretion system protein [Candidatus Eisenbacteria bacterium]